MLSAAQRPSSAAPSAARGRLERVVSPFPRIRMLSATRQATAGGPM